jgi:hypothetical protein
VDSPNVGERVIEQRMTIVQVRFTRKLAAREIRLRLQLQREV